MKFNMEKRFVMKKILIGLFAFACVTGRAQKMADSVIMIVGDKQIPFSEFEYIAHKNNEVDFADAKSLANYVELFKNFKLKVREAEQEELDKSDSFTKEFNEYKSQLMAGFLSDKQGEEEAARILYDRGSEYLVLSQILLPFACEQCVTQDTVELYAKALEIYNRILGGEDFDTLGLHLSRQAPATAYALPADNKTGVNGETNLRYEYLSRFLPLQKLKAFEDAAYATPAGGTTLVRSSEGFHLIRVIDRRPFFGSIQAAYINIPFKTESVTRTRAEVLKLINEAYAKATTGGVDFSSLVHSYSVDTVNNGVLAPFGPGEMQGAVENAVYALAEPGDITRPVVNENGAYIFKLIEKKNRLPFEEMKTSLISDMSVSERNFELYKAFDDYLKKEYSYTLYPEAYAEIENLCDTYFPKSDEFWKKGQELNKLLLTLNGKNFPQREFAYYLQKYPFSAKTYSKDFLREVFALFLRDVTTVFERENLEAKHTDISHLLQEYRDGILLFDISNRKIWNQPIEEQDALEVAWLKELNKKYPVTVNTKALKKLTKKRK
jgi:peptidyl-prolyl cis-trans isomerase SurA